MHSYRDLIVWQKAFALSKEVYHLTASFPDTEKYGLSSQLRRAAVSIVSNIAEGFSRKSLKENYQFFSVAFGSTSEVETQLLLSRELQLVEPDKFRKAEGLLLEVRKMLNSMLGKSRRIAKS